MLRIKIVNLDCEFRLKMQDFEEKFRAFIEQKLHNRYELSEENTTVLQHQGIEAFILKKLLSSKFRYSSLPEKLLQKIDRIVHEKVQKEESIHISIPFGGFKKWQLPSAPHLDWSEVFNVLFLCEYLQPIAAAYKPGVIIHYVSDEIIVHRMNFYPRADLEKYNTEFQKLINYIQMFLPKNIELRYSKIRDEITEAEIFQRFEVFLPEVKTRFENLSDEEKKNKIEKAARNIYRLEDTSEDQKHEVILNSLLLHDIFNSTDWDYDTPWAFAKAMIPVGFMYTGSWGIHLKSCVSSTVQFWVGTGVIEIRNEKMVPHILSFNQYEERKNTFQKIKPNTLKNITPNLEAIEYYC